MTCSPRVRRRNTPTWCPTSRISTASRTASSATSTTACVPHVPAGTESWARVPGCIRIYTDYMAEVQESPRPRSLPMPMLPAWDVEACVQETERLAGLGFRGVNMTLDPQDSGAPDYASRYWDPLWAACSDLTMPAHFHIPSSLTPNAFYRTHFRASQHQNLNPAAARPMHSINTPH